MFKIIACYNVAERFHVILPRTPVLGLICLPCAWKARQHKSPVKVHPNAQSDHFYSLEIHRILSEATISHPFEIYDSKIYGKWEQFYLQSYYMAYRFEAPFSIKKHGNSNTTEGSKCNSYSLLSSLAWIWFLKSTHVSVDAVVYVGIYLSRLRK